MGNDESLWPGNLPVDGPDPRAALSFFVRRAARSLRGEVVLPVAGNTVEDEINALEIAAEILEFLYGREEE